MSTNQGERFSNERYLTMNQVSRALGTTLIDDIWKEVLQYRNMFSVTIPLRTVERNRLRVVLTPKINDRLNQLDRRISRIQARIQEVYVDANHQKALKTLLTRDILKTIAASYEINFHDGIVNQLINHNISVLNAWEMFLNDYYRGLELVAKSANLDFTEALLADVGRLFNVPPLSNYIYRTTEIKTGRQVSVINHVHPHVPVNQISDAIADFYAFMATSTLPTIVQSAAIIFYLDYIKPFEAHSEIIAILMAKAFLAERELALIAPYLNFELILERYRDARDDVFAEVKKSADLTYFIDLLINVLNESLQTIEERIVFVVTHELEAEKHVLPPFKEETQEESVSATPPTDLFEHAQAEVAEKEETFKSEPVPVYTPKKSAIPLPLPPREEEGVKVTPEEANLGITQLPPELSENDILRLERHIRESDPSLSRAQAYFYARHCTMGKYYSINDFKEVTGCAYETARTSMEHLANSGYYRKEKFKNKFIYTPTRKA